jgi:Skp family chaperone for outer membrane proteins
MAKSHLPATAVALALTALPALAQSAPAPTASASALGGPLVVGVCVLSRQDVLTTSKMGVAATARMRELTAQAQAEVDNERQAIQNDTAALEKQKATLPAAQLAERAKPLAARWSDMQLTADQRSRELEATREKALASIALQAQPVIADVYRAHNCGLLLAREVMLGGNSGADLTPDVIKALDAKVATISFDRETLPAAPAQPPVASR